MTSSIAPGTLDGTAHIIQLALTPVFLLSGVATLLNVFGARLARVSDQADHVSGELAGATEADRRDLGRRLDKLHLRALALDTAVVLAAFAGVATCGAVLTLFVGALRDATVASLLFGLFGAAILSTLCALVAFGFEMLLASHAIRLRVAARRRDADADAEG